MIKQFKLRVKRVIVMTSYVHYKPLTDPKVSGTDIIFYRTRRRLLFQIDLSDLKFKNIRKLTNEGQWLLLSTYGIADADN